jgi:hypothetical protein
MWSLLIKSHDVWELTIQYWRRCCEDTKSFVRDIKYSERYHYFPILNVATCDLVNYCYVHWAYNIQHWLIKARRLSWVLKYTQTATNGNLTGKTKVSWKGWKLVNEHWTLNRPLRTRKRYSVIRTSYLSLPGLGHIHILGSNTNTIQPNQIQIHCFSRFQFKYK